MKGENKTSVIWLDEYDSIEEAQVVIEDTIKKGWRVHSIGSVEGRPAVKLILDVEE